MVTHATKRWGLAVFLVIAFTMAAGCSTAPKTVVAKGDAKAAWQFHDIAEIDLIQQNAVVPQPEGVMIIDSRPYKPKYVNGHIPTAVNIPFSQFDKMKDSLPKEKNALLIFYCGGPT
jgi:3-mercaptopyruvate sulfurtransferase SseA